MKYEFLKIIFVKTHSVMKIFCRSFAVSLCSCKSSAKFEFPAFLRAFIGYDGDHQELINDHYGLSTVYFDVICLSQTVLSVNGLKGFYRTAEKRKCSSFVDFFLGWKYID